MIVSRIQLRPGAYYDSVVLMQLQKSLAALPGVVDAGVVMATPANCELLAASDFDLSAIEAKPDDLLIIVKAESEPAATEAIAQVDELLKQRRSSHTQGYRPRSLKGAASGLSDAEWVLISVPGRYAAGVAQEALDLGKHVFLYSDNVSLDEERRLKQKARDSGLLVMGPDCGTAIINGIGLGFANHVRRGNIGIVAASGTGLQAVSSEIHNLGGGISQAIGTGGRDLKEEIGGVTARQALEWLAQDEATGVVVLVSKPPSSSVAADLLNAAQACGKPVVVDFIGYPPPGRAVGNLTFASSLVDAAWLAVDQAGTRTPEASAAVEPLTGYLRGLFSGGTLAYEMFLGLQAVIDPLYSNLAARSDRKLGDVVMSRANTILDLGEDVFTQGRLHPMMDNDLRLRRLRREAADPEVGLILLDVVLGQGSHPDPAVELAPAIAAATSSGKQVIAIVIGTEDDPQDLGRQLELLTAAGATVFRNGSDALAYVYRRLPRVVRDFPPVSFSTGGLSAINVGLESFYESVVAQDGKALHVDWHPPAGGNEKLIGILATMKGIEDLVKDSQASPADSVSET